MFRYFQSFCRVHITVDDVNEHPPRFSSDEYSIQLFTPTSDDWIGPDEFNAFLQVEATDYDVGRNGKITYSITQGRLSRKV